MKKIFQIAALGLSVSILSIGILSSPAHAAIGVATGNVPMIVSGSLLAAAGFTLAMLGFTSPIGAAIVIFGSSGSAAFLLGIVLLDDSAGGLPRFQTLTPAQQAQLSVSAEEYSVYEAELEEIHAAVDAGAAQASAAQVQNVEEAQAYFASEYKNLSPETRSVMNKIVRANVRPQGENN